MKAEIVEVTHKAPKPTYPYLSQNKNTGLVVLMTGKDSGVVVKPDSIYPFGYISTTWCEDKPLEPLPPGEAVQLSN